MTKRNKGNERNVENKAVRRKREKVALTLSLQEDSTNCALMSTLRLIIAARENDRRAKQSNLNPNPQTDASKADDREKHCPQTRIARSKQLYLLIDN